MRSDRARWRVGAFAASAVLSLLAAACSSGASSSTTTVAPGTAVLGAPFSVWVRANPANDVGGQSGYGASVAHSSGSVPQFTDVRQLDGRVVGMHMNLPSGTRLGPAEVSVRRQLPTDARQTASWRGTYPAATGAPPAYCEFVNYQSVALARSLGIPPPAPGVANIGTSFSQQTGSRAGSSSIATVDAADISTAANVVGAPC